MKYGITFGLTYAFILCPLEHLFGAFPDMMFCDTLEDKTLRVPTFYSPPDHDDILEVLVGGVVAIVFGAIHCIAWSFHFATLPERWAWRISAILVSALPVFMIALSPLLKIFEKKEHKTAGMILYEDILSFILFSMFCLYILTRIALLILPFIALCALVPGAYVELDWVSFLPHI